MTAFDWTRCPIGIHVFTVPVNTSYVLETTGVGVWLNGMTRLAGGAPADGEILLRLDECSTPIYMEGFGQVLLPRFGKLRFDAELSGYDLRVVVFGEPAQFAYQGVA